MSEHHFDLRAYWRQVSQRWRLVLAMSVAGLLLGGLYAASTRPMFEARGTLLVERERPMVAPYVDFKEPGRSEADYKTQFEILKSRVLARRVIEALELRTHPEFDGKMSGLSAVIDTLKSSLKAWIHRLRAAVAPASDLETSKAVARAAPDPDADLIDQMLKRLYIGAQAKIRLVEVRFQAHDNGLAADVVNTLSHLYIEFNTEMRFAALRNALTWLREQVQDIGQKVSTSERTLQQYTNEHEVYSLRDRQPGLIEKIAELETMLTDVQTKRIELEMVSKAATAARGRELEGVPVVSENGLIQQLKGVQVGLLRTYTELRHTYNDRHPRVSRVKSQMDAVADKIEREAEQIIEAKLLQYRVAKAREAALIEHIQTLWAEVKELNEKAVQYGMLEREAESNRRLADLLIKRLKEASASMSGDLTSGSNIQVIDVAEVPGRPISISRTRALGMGGAMGLMMGLGVAALMGYLDRTLKTPEEVEAVLGLPVVGMIEHFQSPARPKPGSLGGGRLVTVDAPQSRAAEAFKTLRANLLLNAAEAHRGAVVLVSSLHPQDGKSTVAANLAWVMAQTERRVLLVDADLRHPVLHKVFDVDNRMGLSDLLLTETYEETLDLCQDEALWPSGLSILTAGEKPTNPSELLASSRMPYFLERARARYDVVIVDSPPTLAVSDAMVLSAWVDRTLLVLRANTASHDHARRAAASLLSPPVELLGEEGQASEHHSPELSLGIVVNDVDPRRHRSSRWGASDRYYNA